MNIKQKLKGHLERVLYLCFNPKHKLLASSSADETVKMWNLNCKGTSPHGRARLV